MSRRNKKKIYSIIFANHGKQKEVICSEETETKIYKRFNQLLKENKKIVFPMRFNNEKHVMVESEHELIIIKCRDYLDNQVNKVKDDTGKFINYQTDNEDWIVVNRAPYNVEETFWVYGYHPKIQRKTFQWIFENFIAKDANNKYMFKTIVLYLNKILIECNGHLEMVICKNKSDSIRMYNLLEQFCKKGKYKYVAFFGDLANSKYKSDWKKKIMNLTHWDSKKVGRSSTRD